MAVKQSKNGTWFTQFRYKNKFGKEVHKCKRGCSTAEEAQAWEDDFIAYAGCTMGMTFVEFYEVYEADVRPRLRKHAWPDKDYLVMSKIMPFFKNFRISEVQGIDIIRWQNDLMRGSNNNGQGYAPTYLRTVNIHLFAVLNHTARYYGLRSNPAVRTMKMDGKERSEIQFWTKEESLKFADEMMEKPREFLMFEILCWTGIREGEILALMPSAFDLSRGTMRIDKSYQRFDGRDVITGPKTPKSIRTIKPPKFLVEEIADYLKCHPEIGPNDRMFPVTKYQISRAMKSGCRKSGVKKIRVHDLRHSHVSLLIDKGFTALAIAERMGHEATGITFRYAHLFPTVQEDMANALDDERGGF